MYQHILGGRAAPSPRASPRACAGRAAYDANGRRHDLAPRSVVPRSPRATAGRRLEHGTTPGPPQRQRSRRRPRARRAWTRRSAAAVGRTNPRDARIARDRGQALAPSKNRTRTSPRRTRGPRDENDLNFIASARRRSWSRARSGRADTWPIKLGGDPAGPQRWRRSGARARGLGAGAAVGGGTAH